MAPGRADTPASGKLLATARQAFADGDCRSHVDAVVWATLSALIADILTSSHLPERCRIPGGKRRFVVWMRLSLSAPSVWADLAGRTGLAPWAFPWPWWRVRALCGGAQLMKNCW
jgi:hypothetical protein